MTLDTMATTIEDLCQLVTEIKRLERKLTIGQAATPDVEARRARGIAVTREAVALLSPHIARLKVLEEHLEQVRELQSWFGRLDSESLMRKTQELLADYYERTNVGATGLAVPAAAGEPAPALTRSDVCAIRVSESSRFCHSWMPVDRHPSPVGGRGSRRAGRQPGGLGSRGEGCGGGDACYSPFEL